MTQAEHIELLKTNTTQAVNQANQTINELYQKYIDADDRCSGPILEELLSELEKKYTRMVRQKLRIANCYSRDALSDVMEDASLAIWQPVVNSRFNKTIQPSFANYCAGIYSNKAVDFIRQLCKQQKLCGFVDSLDRITSEDGSTIGNFVKDNSTVNNPVPRFEAKMEHTLLRTLLLIYCQILTEKSDVPPRSLALYYTQIAPHLLHILKEEDTIPDTKLSSPKWAHQRMGRHTISQLSDQSEKELQHYVSSALVWCAAFRQQLQKPEIGLGNARRILLADIVYTDMYSQKQTGHMADYLHRQVMQELVYRVVQNDHLASLVIAYVQDIDWLRHQIGEKQNDASQ